MAQPLENISVAITEHRYTKEFAALFERLGAKVYPCPVLEEREVENRSELQSFVRSVCSGNQDMMIFLTGVGAKFLIGEAESMGMKDQFLAGLDKGTVVVRGPKPVAALRQSGVRIDVIPQTPTTEGVIEALRSKDLKDRRIGIQLYGTPNPTLVSALESKGATVTPVHIYDYGTVADPGVVNTLVTKLLNGEIQAIAFTSAPQVRVLFDLAAKLGISESLRPGAEDQGGDRVHWRSHQPRSRRKRSRAENRAYGIEDGLDGPSGGGFLFKKSLSRERVG